MSEATRSSSTMLPALPRRRRRDVGRLVARVLCVLLALVGLLPIGLGALVRTEWARTIAARETQRLVRDLGVDATYELELRLWPMRVTLANLRVEATDGGSPFATARWISARPRLFGLLAGKLVLDEIEIEQPKVRVVLEGGQLKNLAVPLPESDGGGAKKRPPFSVVSTSEAELDVTIDGARVQAFELDADVTTDEDERGHAAFEIALRMAEARGSLRRVQGADTAIDDDTVCRVDGRVRIEDDRILVRRFSAHGAVDLDPAPDTHGGCDLDRKDARFVELALGHLAVVLPKTEGQPPNIDGHVKLRAPIGAVRRLPNAPDVGGWVMVDADVRYTPETPIPDVTGRIEVHEPRIATFAFARSIVSEVSVRRGVVTSPLTTVAISGGVAELRDTRVEPLAPGVPIRTRLDARGVSFVELMRDLDVSQRPHVTWDIEEVHSASLAGTIVPLAIDGDLAAHTTNFAVFDKATDDPARTRAVGVKDARLKGKVAIRADALEFHHIDVTTPRGVVHDVLVSIGFHEFLRVEVPDAKVDLADVSPIGSIAMAGIVTAKAKVVGPFADPILEADVGIENYVLGDIPFGNVTQAHVVSHVAEQVVDLSDAKAVKGKSPYELVAARLDFGGAASMKLDGQATSKAMNVRDFFAMFQLDEDPRFDQIDGVLSANARIHFALGGPEDVCGGGFLDVRATTDARDINLLGERFDAGHADFDYRWIDKDAGIDGAEVDIRSVSLSKVRRAAGGSLGTVLGSASIRRGGELRGNVVVQGYPLARTDLLGPAASMIEGSVSGVARVSGALDAFELEASLDTTPVRVGAAAFGGSDLHVRMTQDPGVERPTGKKTKCGAPIYAPFDKKVYLAALPTQVQGKYEVNGALFGGQVRLDGLTVTRQDKPVVTGKATFARFDLGPVMRAMSGAEAPAPGEGPAVGGSVSGVLDIERIAMDDLARAKAVLRPESLSITRGAQHIDLRKTGLPITLTNDALELPELTFDLATAEGLKGAVSLNGTVKKITRGGQLALEARLSPIDLGVLVAAVPRVTRAAGKLSGSAKIGGTPRDPEIEGALEVRGGELGLKGFPGDITDLEIDVVASETELRVARATGRFLGGDLALSAQMPLRGGSAGVVRAGLTGRHLYVAPQEGVRAVLDADLDVTYNPNAATAQGRLPFVEGDVTIVEFDYTRPITVDLTGFKGGAKRTVVESYDPSLDVVAFGIDVRSRVPLRIRNNLVDASLVMDPRGLHVTGTNQRLGLRGELSTSPGGRFRVFANDFELKKGTIRFDDPQRIAPRVDILGTTEYRRYSNTVSTAGPSTSNTTGGAAVTSGSLSSGGTGGSLWRISLHAYGDTEDLKVDMTSDPALSREDIFFLLTIGLTRAEVDQVRAGSVYASAAFEALGTVSGADRAVKKAIPVIDDFRFGSAYSPRTGRTEPQVTLGRRLTDNVRANVSTGLTEDRQLRSNVEWRLSRPLSVQTSYDNINTVSSGSVGNFGLDFRWRLEFD